MSIIDVLFPEGSPSPFEPGPKARTALGARPPTPKLAEQVRELRQRLGESVSAISPRVAEDLAAGLMYGLANAIGALNTELADVMRVGLVFSSGRPGLRRMEFVFTRRHSERRLECSLTTRPDGGELALVAEQSGRTVEIARVGLRDPSGLGVLREAAERFLLSAVEEFAQGAA
jgi:hypothetical protein